MLRGGASSQDSGGNENNYNERTHSSGLNQSTQGVSRSFVPNNNDIAR